MGSTCTPIVRIESPRTCSKYRTCARAIPTKAYCPTKPTTLAVLNDLMRNSGSCSMGARERASTATKTRAATTVTAKAALDDGVVQRADRSDAEKQPGRVAVAVRDAAVGHERRGQGENGRGQHD